jgi:integrase
VVAGGAERFTGALDTERCDRKRHRGFDPVVIAKILGHRSDVTTRRIYIHAPETPRFDELDA